MCDAGYRHQGTACVVEPNPCQGVTCAGYGFCVPNASGSATCLCNDGRVATNLDCTPLTDPCDGVACSGRGACVVASGARPVCVCDAGYVGDGVACVETTSANVCEGVDCDGHGACVASSTGPVCLCEEGYHWKGAHCLPNVDPCGDQPCGPNGACLFTASGPYCVCVPGYVSTGAACVPAVGPCALVTCGGHGACVESGGAPVCLCDAGYLAQGLDCLAEVSPCAGVDCSGHGSCVPTATGVACICELGYYGAGMACLVLPESVIPGYVASDASNVAADPRWGLTCISNEIIVGVVEGHSMTAFLEAVSQFGGAVAFYDPDLRTYPNSAARGPIPWRAFFASTALARPRRPAGAPRSWLSFRRLAAPLSSPPLPHRRRLPMPPDAPVVLIQWEKVLDDLLSRTARFPRDVRYSLAVRIDNLALDILERLIEARFDKRRQDALTAANLGLEKLRVLLRVAHARRILDTGGLEHVARALDDVGRMVGGWLKHDQGHST